MAASRRHIAVVASAVAGLAILLVVALLLAGTGPALFRRRSRARPERARRRCRSSCLPFANLSAARDQQYFADAVTEDLTADLSRLSGAFVISSNTAFTYRDRRADTRRIGRELGVRYVVDGSIRRAGEQVRATCS